MVPTKSSRWSSPSQVKEKSKNETTRRIGRTTPTTRCTTSLPLAITAAVRTNKHKKLSLTKKGSDGEGGTTEGERVFVEKVRVTGLIQEWVGTGLFIPIPILYYGKSNPNTILGAVTERGFVHPQYIFHTYRGWGRRWWFNLINGSQLVTYNSSVDMRDRIKSIVKKVLWTGRRDTGLNFRKEHRKVVSSWRTNEYLVLLFYQRNIKPPVEDSSPIDRLPSWENSQVYIPTSPDRMSPLSVSHFPC